MTKLFILLGVLCIIQILLAKICGPHSREWGNKAYLWCGIIILIASFLLPFLQHSFSAIKQISIGLLFVVLSAAVWLAGFFLGGFKIISRLF